MPQNTLITVLRGKATVQLPYKALIGEYSERLFKIYGHNVTISDPKLNDKLSEAEYRDLANRYPYLAPSAVLRPEPPLLTEEVAELMGEGRTEVKRRGRKPKNTEQ
jgi:hypothetical protein